MIYYLLAGVTMGVAAGLSPGPLMALVIAESLRGGFAAGLRVSMAPLITDSLLISLALLVTAPLPPWALSAVSLAGGAIMIVIGWNTARANSPVVIETATSGQGALLRGVVTNLLNPHAFLFWLTIGAPLVRTGLATGGWTAPALFMAAFFLMLIGTKLLLAYGVSRGRRFLQGRAYRLLLGVAGAMLAGLGVWRIWEGWVGLG